VYCLRKKLKGQCSCGFSFETLRGKNDAIAMIKSHVERFHKYFLPFGITNNEAQALLTEENGEIKPKISTSSANSVQTEYEYSFKNTPSASQSLLDRLLGEDIEAECRKPERKKAQLIV
jgi:hypothetical protein